MAEYPVMLQLADRLCVVVGSGPVGMRKARGLLEAGARVRLVGPQLGGSRVPEGVEVRPRVFRPDDLAGAFLVFAATGDAVSDRAVAAEARRRGIPICLAGRPREGDFTVPALLRRGDLAVAVSTAGRSPALAGVVKERLEEQLPATWALALEIAAAARQKALQAPEDIAYGREALHRLLDRGLLALLAAQDVDAVDRLLREVLGGCGSVAGLGVSLPERKP